MRGLRAFGGSGLQDDHGILFSGQYADDAVHETCADADPYA